ncbi:IS66 family transposase zinc-finger binding domain-containing protein [Thalassobacter stenotrophicus]|uniref:IS66 family transposase zinc-finger binding domain-containing protein n=1 Tax=Thalassobacter stenotrophicus TaxID=266809 RepID=UPI003990250B
MRSRRISSSAARSRITCHRVDGELTICDDNYTQCGGTSRRVGENATEKLEYVPSRFIVNPIVRPRVACLGCEACTQAVVPSCLIERRRAYLGLLAHVLVNKYAAEDAAVSAKRHLRPRWTRY